MWDSFTIYFRRVFAKISSFLIKTQLPYYYFIIIFIVVKGVTIVVFIFLMRFQNE